MSNPCGKDVSSALRFASRVHPRWCCASGSVSARCYDKVGFSAVKPSPSVVARLRCACLPSSTYPLAQMPKLLVAAPVLRSGARANVPGYLPGYAERGACMVGFLPCESERQGSNLRSRAPKARAIPLGYTPRGIDFRRGRHSAHLSPQLRYSSSDLGG